MTTIDSLAPVARAGDGPDTHRDSTSAPRRQAGQRLLLPRLALALICLGQVALANRPGLNKNAFEDEGLYVYIGHRMIAHLLHGTVVTEYPGKYFSGAPGLYPVLAAMGDDVAGLAGARTVSLAFAVLASLAVFGLGKELFSRTAGLFGAATFALSGPVLFQSHFATIDAMAMALFASGAWLAVRSTKRDDLLWAPVVAVLLALAFLTKYGTGVYTPVVAALAVATSRPRSRSAVAFRAIFVVLATAIISFFLIAYRGADIVDGLASTTSSRVILAPLPRHTILLQAATWVGPLLALAAVAALLRLRRSWPAVAVLTLAAVVAPLEQVRIGEGESLSKHLAFGLVFACPLVGDLLARLARARLIGLPVAAALVLSLLGVRYSHEFGTTWVDDRDLVPALQHYTSLARGLAILGEQPAPQHYALRKTTSPSQWTDTYQFNYADGTGQAAYEQAIQESHFGVIYLNLQTPNGRTIHDYLTNSNTPYGLVDKVNRYLNGRVVGKWLVYLPKALVDSQTAGPVELLAAQQQLNDLVKQFAYSTDVNERRELLQKINLLRTQFAVVVPYR